MRIAARWACAVFGFFANDCAEAARLCAEALDLCGDDLEAGAAVLGYSPWLVIRAVGGTALVLSGRVREGSTMIAQALGDRGRRHRLTQALCGGFAAVESQVRGEHRASLGVVQRSLETLEELGATVGVLALVGLYLGQSHALNRQWDAARESLEQALRLTADSTFRQLVPGIRTWLAYVALATGDPEHARRDLDAAFEAAGRQKLFVPLVQAHVVRARLLRLEGAGAEEVARELTAAERLAEQTSQLGLVPEIHCERAALHRRDGRVADARRELERARDLYREMGAAPNAERRAAEIEALVT